MIKARLRSLNIPVYPFFAAIAPVMLYFNTQAVNDVPVDLLLLPCAAVLMATAVLYLPPCLAIHLNRQLRKPSKELESQTDSAPQSYSIQLFALWIALAWTLFFSMTVCIELDGICTAFNLPFNLISLMPSVLPFFWLGLVTLAVLPLVRRNWLSYITSIFHQVFMTFFLLQLSATLYFFMQIEAIVKPKVKAVQQSAILKVALRSPSVAQSKKEKPDIYYLILDEMASSDVLKKYVDYHDDWFREALEQRGFFVTRKSLSNYPLTRLSLSSSLNMTYLDDFAPTVGRNSADMTTTAVLLRNNAVGQVLKKNGYEFIQVDSATSPTNNSDIADRVVHCGFFDHFSDKLVRSTLAALSPQAMSWLSDNSRRTILKQFAETGNVREHTSDSKNIFVFSHILCPHEPFQFDADGNSISVPGSRSNSHWTEETKKAYVGQAKFAQRKAIDAIDAIMKSPRYKRTKPLIIIQGDHGTHCSDYLSRDNPSDELLHERYGILNAYLVPGQIREQLNDETEPVNTFRIILRTLFDLNLPDLNHRQMYATYEKAFNFTDVTARVKDQSDQTRKLGN